MGSIQRNGLSYSDAGKLGAIASKSILEKIFQERILQYNKNPTHCKECNVALQYKKRTNKYCSKKCSAIFNNKNKRRKCAGCFNFAATSPNKYCSRNCYLSDRRKNKIEEILNGKINHPRTLREYLLEKRGHRCEICGNTEWISKPIPINVDHIDGNSENSSLDNLRLLCCNCHAQTPTYGNKNKGKGRHYRRVRYAEGKSY